MSCNSYGMQSAFLMHDLDTCLLSACLRKPSEDLRAASYSTYLYVKIMRRTNVDQQRASNLREPSSENFEDL